MVERGIDRRLLTLALGTFAIGTGNYVFTGVLGGLASDLAVSVALAGQLVTVFAITNAVGSPILVSLTNRLGRRRLLVATMLVYSLANLVAAVLPTFGLLALSRVIAAGAAAIFTPVAAAVAAGLVPEERRGRALAIVTGGLTIAFVAGIPLGTVIGGVFGWRATFLLAGLLGVVSLGAIRIGLPEIHESTRRRRPVVLSVLRRPAVAANVGLTALGFTSVFVAVSYVGPLLTDITGFDESGIGGLQVFLGIAGVTGVAIGGYGSDRWNTPRLLVAVFAVLTFGSLPFSVFAGAGGGLLAIGGAAAALMLGGLALFALVPVQQYRLVRIAPDAPNVVLALNASAIFAGQGLGAGLGGLTVEYGSLASLGWVGAAVSVVSLVLLIGVRIASRSIASESGDIAGN